MLSGYSRPLAEVELRQIYVKKATLEQGSNKQAP